MVSYFLKVAGSGDGRCRSTMAPVLRPWATYAFRLLLPPENDCENTMLHMRFVPP